MTSIHKFTASDLSKVQTQKSVFKLQHFLFLICAIIISLIAGLFGLKSFGYWISVAACFIFMIVYYFVTYIIDLIAFRKDIRQQEKICGDLTVINKSNKRNDFVFKTDLKELKKINILNKNIFEQILIGDKLYIELTKQSKFLLKLEKNGQQLLEKG